MKQIKKYKFLFFCTIVTLFSAESQGTQLYLNSQQAITAAISRQGLTRITVKDDRILNVFGVTGEYVLETDEDLGQVFIRPMGTGSLNPISLTLTTEKGLTQDLLLTPKDKTPEALILQAVEPSRGSSKEDLTQKSNQSFPSRGDIEDLLYACQEGRIPVSYKLMPLDLKLLKHNNYLIREIRNDHLRGLTYEIRNDTQKPLHLVEEEFAQDSHVIAVLITQRTLNSGERTHVYVIAQVHP